MYTSYFAPSSTSSSTTTLAAAELAGQRCSAHLIKFASSTNHDTYNQQQLQGRAMNSSTGSVSFSGVILGKKRRPFHVTDSCAETLIIHAGQKVDYYHTIFRIISIMEGYPWSYKTVFPPSKLLFETEWGRIAKTKKNCYKS
jgi:hypothetical protein